MVKSTTVINTVTHRLAPSHPQKESLPGTEIAEVEYVLVTKDSSNWEDTGSKGLVIWVKVK